MLTADLALYWRRGKAVGPRYLDPAEDDIVAVSDDLIAIVREHAGYTRGELDASLTEYIGQGTDYRVLRGMIKLLLDRCDFDTAGLADPFDIRRVVFEEAALLHPVSVRPGVRARALENAAGKLGLTVANVEAWLYGDLQDNQRLLTFEDLDARELIDLYNLAQAQALLYRSVGMTLHLSSSDPTEFRRVFDALKAYRLVHTIKSKGKHAFQVTISGPVSLFHRSQKYGVQLAVFLPALLECAGWSMRAEIEMKPRGVAYFDLDSSQTELRSSGHGVFAERQPAVQKVLTSTAKAAGPWSASAGSDILDLGESAFIPDVVFRREDGVIVYLEVLGFWTPKHVLQRLEECARGGLHAVVFAASEDYCATRDDPSRLPVNVVIYKSSLDFRALKPALEHLAGVG